MSSPTFKHCGKHNEQYPFNGVCPHCAADPDYVPEPEAPVTAKYAVCPQHPNEQHPIDEPCPFCDPDGVPAKPLPAPKGVAPNVVCPVHHHQHPASDPCPFCAVANDPGDAETAA
jgi:hypothetical protein